MKITESEILVFDTETTGVDPATCRIVELGAIVLRRGQLAEKFHTYVNPGCPIPAETTAVHGIDDAKVAGAPRFEAVAARVAERFGAFPLTGGYNAIHFDVPLLNAEMGRAGMGFTVDPSRSLDPVIFCRWHLRAERDRKLATMCAHPLFKVPLDNAHTAVADASAAALLLLAMVEGGIVPDDVDAALAEQTRYAAVQADESERWSYWLYTDRRDGKTVRMGAGKNCGYRLADVDPGYLRFMLGIADLHAGARAAFEAEIGRMSSRV